MEVYQFGTRPISSLSEFDSMSPTPNIAVCPGPAFEIDDVFMETVGLDVIQSRSLCPEMN